ncbi:hypothetical protein C4D60_Mb10t12000 [Musa balbisiana]|uniref:Protein Asterix n=1 Tax=Musa balbisiana TaxID=52838 RepID=A0A4S8IWG2_MUSBA|nr:hypothetical protein C4D60_Mb10t12000 [Musa balbisiana]
MKETTSSSANDPRLPSAAKPYYKLCSWLAIIFCAQSLANMKNFENDFKQLSMAFMFGVMGLVTNYLGPSRAAKQR